MKHYDRSKIKEEPIERPIAPVYCAPAYDDVEQFPEMGEMIDVYVLTPKQ